MRSKVFKTAKTTSQNSDKKESRLARRGAECKIMVAKQSFPDRPEKVSGGEELHVTSGNQPLLPYNMLEKTLSITMPAYEWKSRARAVRKRPSFKPSFRNLFVSRAKMCYAGLRKTSALLSVEPLDLLWQRSREGWQTNEAHLPSAFQSTECKIAR